MKVYFKTLGCRLNEAEVMKWMHEFEDNGASLVQKPEDATICVLNSCAVTKEAVSKSKKQLRRLRRTNNNAHIVLSGCFPSLNQYGPGNIKEANQIIKNHDKDLLVKKTLTAYKQINNDKKDLSIKPKTNKNKNTYFQSRAFVKVQDGCRNRCSFCIVTIARGNEKSKPIKFVVDEINNLVDKGFNEVIITGVHLGGYGSDIGENLKSLLINILNNTNIKRIRLGSLEPWDIPEGFFDLWQNNRLMPHFHLPLQSGCDKTLKRMSRRCLTKDYEFLLKEARQKIPHVNITTDLIVGFPQENEEEFKISKDFASRCKFGHIHVFPYSKRDGTRAASFNDHVIPQVKKERCQEIIRLAKSSKETALKNQIGKKTKVLTENKIIQVNNQSFRLSYSENFFKVGIKCDPLTLLPNEIHSCVLTDVLYVDNEPLLTALF